MSCDNPKTCDNSKKCDNSKTCEYCTYLKECRKDYDLELYRKIGSATYSQLIDHFPGVFNEKYADHRNNGDSLSYTHFFSNIFSNLYDLVYTGGNINYEVSSKRLGLPYQKVKCEYFGIENNIHTFIDKFPFPPNFISSYVLDYQDGESSCNNDDTYIEGCKFKFLMIKDIIENEIDIGFKSMVESSTVYNNPEFKYSDVVGLSVAATLIFGITLKILIEKYCR